MRIVGAMRHLEAHGLMHEGIYRISGLGRDVQLAAAWLATGVGDIPFAAFSVHEWAGAIKTCLHRFEPFSSYRLYEFLRACSQSVASDRTRSLTHVLSWLPRRNLVRLRYACGHLCRIARAADVNLMTASNLAKLWGGILARPNEAPATNLGAELRLTHEQFLVGLMLLSHFVSSADASEEPWTTDEDGATEGGGPSAPGGSASGNPDVPTIIIPPAPTRQRSEPLLSHSPPYVTAMAAAAAAPPTPGSAAASPTPRRLMPSYASLRFSWRPTGGGGFAGAGSGSLARAAAGAHAASSRRLPDRGAPGASPRIYHTLPLRGDGAAAAAAGAPSSTDVGSSRSHIVASRFHASPLPLATAARPPPPAADAERPPIDEEMDGEGDDCEQEASMAWSEPVLAGLPPSRASTGPVRHFRGAGVNGGSGSDVLPSPGGGAHAQSPGPAATTLPPSSAPAVAPPRRQPVQGGRHFTALTPSPTFDTSTTSGSGFAPAAREAAPGPEPEGPASGAVPAGGSSSSSSAGEKLSAWPWRRMLSMVASAGSGATDATSTSASSSAGGGVFKGP